LHTNGGDERHLRSDMCRQQQSCKAAPVCSLLCLGGVTNATLALLVGAAAAGAASAVRSVSSSSLGSATGALGRACGCRAAPCSCTGRRWNKACSLSSCWVGRLSLAALRHGEWSGVGELSELRL
jgi:hypothetical protein